MPRERERERGAFVERDKEILCEPRVLIAYLAWDDTPPTWWSAGPQWLGADPQCQTSHPAKYLQNYWCHLLSTLGISLSTNFLIVNMKAWPAPPVAPVKIMWHGLQQTHLALLSRYQMSAWTLSCHCPLGKWILWSNIKIHDSTCKISDNGTPIANRTEDIRDKRKKQTQSELESDMVGLFKSRHFLSPARTRAPGLGRSEMKSSV